MKRKTKKAPEGAQRTAETAGNKKGSKAAKNSPPKSTTKSTPKPSTAKEEIKFPDKFPFWARLKIGKHRPTLVIDEEVVSDKKTGKAEDNFVHREVTHTKGTGEEIKPNPDKKDPRPMYLKKARKLPKILFKKHNKDWEIPKELKERYEINNHKEKK